MINKFLWKVDIDTACHVASCNKKRQSMLHQITLRERATKVNLHISTSNPFFKSQKSQRW